MGSKSSGGASSSWGSIRTTSNDLDAKDGDEEERIPLRNGGGRGGGKKDKPLDAGNKWQSFEVLRGRQGPEDVPANHSHFQWGETVTRAPAHPTRHKYVLPVLVRTQFVKALKLFFFPFRVHPAE